MKLETWNYDKASPPRQELVIVDNERLVARLDCDFVGDNPYSMPRDQAEKYGALFASAPELLAACGEIVRVLNALGWANVASDWPVVTDACQLARAAIAKATGAKCDT